MGLKVAIVDDDESVRDVLRKGFDRMQGSGHGSSYGSGEEALAGIPKNRPDAVLMDIRMPVMSGIECTRKLKMVLPELPVIVLTGAGDPAMLFQALMAGASGYLTKPVSPRQCLEAVVEVLDGGAPLSREVGRILVQSFQPNGERQLSRRQREVMACLFQGLSDKQIAKAMDVGLPTVQTHMHRMFEKLGVKTRGEAMSKYLGMSGGQR